MSIDEEAGGGAGCEGGKLSCLQGGGGQAQQGQDGQGEKQHHQRQAGASTRSYHMQVCVKFFRRVERYGAYINIHLRVVRY